jgi:IclR family transcriptional regulator, KDG regulon repressor
MKTVNKALDILEKFLEKEQSIGVIELSRMTGFHPSTVNRICLNFAKRGYLNQSGNRGKYSLGTKFFEFTSVIKQRNSLRDLAMPFLVKLQQDVDETVTLACIEGTQLIQIAVVPSNHLVSINTKEGAIYPLYNTGLGKAILANFTGEQLIKYAREVKFTKSTPNTLTNIDDLEKNLALIRKQGVAFDDEELTLGVRNVSAVIKNKEGNIVGAIGVVGPSTRLTRDKMEEIAPLVKKYAAEITKNLGYIFNSENLR